MRRFRLWIHLNLAAKSWSRFPGMARVCVKPLLATSIMWTLLMIWLNRSEFFYLTCSFEYLIIMIQDFSNPHVRKHLRFYPSDGRGSCTEFWDAQKLSQGENLEQLTPMASDNGVSYFVDEVCRLVDGSLFIPKMFFQREDHIWARGYDVAMVCLDCNFTVNTLIYSLRSAGAFSRLFYSEWNGGASIVWFYRELYTTATIVS